MQKLDSKAVWLFFFQNLMAIFLLLPVLLFLSVFILSMSEGPAYHLMGNGLWSLISGPPIVIFVILYIVIAFITAKLAYDNWKYELTDSVLKIEKGIIWKKYISIPYERIQNVDIYRGVLARLLGLSDLQVQTAGYSASDKSGMGTEGRLPALPIKTAESLRDSLIHKVKSPRQGL